MRLIALLSLFFSLLVIFYIGVYVFIYKPDDTHYSTFNTSSVLAKDKVSSGYTLIAPYNRLLNDDPQWVGNIYLLDMLGKPVHTWKTKKQVLYSVLKTNGNLLMVMESPKYTVFYPPGGNTGTIQELTWDSKVVWEYKNEAMHHDVVPLKNGNVVVALWEKTPEEITQRVLGGEQSPLDNVLWSDEIVEIDRKGKIVWSWHSYEHLDPELDTIGTMIPKYAWTVTNGISHVEKNPIDGQEAYLISMRSISTVFLIRKKDGEIIWRSPKGMLNTQHDPTLLPNGNILVFDNGFYREPSPHASFGSRAVEINPKTNKIVWQFDGGKGVIDKVRFYAPIVGGAQRLENGNTLITDGTRGHLFEVTKSGEVVWDFVSPYLTHSTGPFPNNFLFKTRRYGEKQITWPEKISEALNEDAYNLHKLLKNIYPQ